jgi:hypothetical protein
MDTIKGLIIILLLFSAPVIAGEYAGYNTTAGSPTNPVQKPDKDCE